ncbi:hypothetical protein Tco_1249231, partial [Tanacetum coccineum]
MASMGSLPCLNTGTFRAKSCGENSDDKVIHTVEINMVTLVVEIKSSEISSDELDKETRSSDGLQPKQEDLSCVHALNGLHLHEIHVVPNVHQTCCRSEAGGRSSTRSRKLPEEAKYHQLMCSDELYKFCDGTLTSVRMVLHDIASNLRMEYFLKRQCSERDRTRSRIMIKK